MLQFIYLIVKLFYLASKTMSYETKLHVDKVHVVENKLHNGDGIGGIVGVKKTTEEIVRLSAGTAGQILTYTGTGDYNVGWENSASSSIPTYQTVTIAGDPGTVTVAEVGDGSAGPYNELYQNVSVHAVDLSGAAGSTDYVNTLETVGAIPGTQLVITIIGMSAGSTYTVHVLECVLNGGGTTNFMMDSVGQGIRMVYTTSGKGWVLIGGTGATPTNI